MGNVDPVQDVVDLLSDVTNGINYDNIENTSSTLRINDIYDNERIDMVNLDHILVYHVSNNRDFSSYYNRSSYHDYTSLAIQIIARKRRDADNSGGLYFIKAEVERVLEVFQEWKVKDATANFDHLYIERGKDLSDKRNNFFKYVIDIELVCIGVNRSTS